jgi:hypothetical protein
MLDSFIRCRPEDGTNGFFIACFVRKLGEGENPLKRKAEEELDELTAVGDERKDSEEYEEWHGISGGAPGPASQPAMARKKKRKKKARPVE